MATIKELNKYDRPLEKAQRYGLKNLADNELLAILLRTGFHGKNVTELAAETLKIYNGFYGLSKANFEELMTLKGIKKSKALILETIFEIHNRLINKIYELKDEKVDSEYLYNKYNLYFSSKCNEELVLVLVDKNMRIIYERFLVIGTDSLLNFSVKDLWRELLIHKAHGFYLIHNHPNGDPNPSSEDIEVTSEIIRKSKELCIKFFDHIIVGENCYFSLSNLLKR